MKAPSAESRADCILFDLVLAIADVAPITARQFWLISSFCSQKWIKNDFIFMGIKFVHLTTENTTGD